MCRVSGFLAQNLYSVLCLLILEQDKRFIEKCCLQNAQRAALRAAGQATFGKENAARQIKQEKQVCVQKSHVTRAPMHGTYYKRMHFPLDG